jgi:hypothetical protein
MRFISVLLAGFLTVVAFASAPKAQVAQVHTVYLLPMTNGLDQYLANRLTNLGVFQVVADPKKADAVLTDRLGDSFESRLGELFPDEAPPPKPAKDAKGAKPPAAPKDTDKAKDKDEPDTAMKGDAGVPFSAFRRAKGTVFLVDSHNRKVLWSIYEQPKNSSASEMDRTAERIASRLKREITGK